jgi:hypothetical protein
MHRVRFDGRIAGVGNASGTQLVLGHWPRSLFGPVSDVMVERPECPAEVAAKLGWLHHEPSP